MRDSVNEKKDENELVSYYVVNTELPMSPEKIGVQMAHMATLLTLNYCHEKDFRQWVINGQKKIALGGKQKDLEKLIAQGFDYIRDFGLTEIPLTEIPPNSLTVVGLKPMTRVNAKKFIKRLQLLKVQVDKNEKK